MINCCNAYAQIKSCSRTFCTAVRCHGLLFQATLTEGRSFYAYRIYIRKFLGIFPLAVTYLMSVSGRSPYLPAAIVRAHNFL
jgi:hypothetical protein